MTLVLIGSEALKRRFPDFAREPEDMDIATTDKSSTVFLGEAKYDYLHNPILCARYEDSGCCLRGYGIATPEELLTLKMSHIFWEDAAFDKTMWDIQFLLSKGVEYDPELYDELYAFWPTQRGEIKKSDLTLDKKEFFKNAINYDEHEHDFLHTLINPVPIYTRILKGEVELDPLKFHALNHEDRVNLVREEVMVMAAERYKGQHYGVRYVKMIKKFLKFHATDYIAQFMMLNWKEVSKPPFNYMKVINDKLTTLNLPILN